MNHTILNHTDSQLKLFQISELKTKWIETLFISFLFPSIGYLVDYKDPFFFDYAFPWLVFAPLLVTLRYGFAYGFVCISLLIGMVTIVYFLGWQQASFMSNEILIGMLLVTIISAEFHDTLYRKIKLLEDKYNYVRLRTDEFTRDYHILKGSHNQLEQHLANHAKSLRSCLIDLEQQTLSLKCHGGEPLKGVGKEILKLFGNHVNIHTAAIYEINEQNKIDPEPVANFGRPSPLAISDPLIKEALKTRYVTSINMTNNNAMVAGGALVVIPLVDVYRKIWGLVVVNEMPLFSLEENTMDLLAVLGGSIGDLIKRRAESSGNTKSLEIGLARILIDIRQLNTSAAIVGVIVNAEKNQSEYRPRFLAELRVVDRLWILKENQKYHFFVIALPYTDSQGAFDFLKRVGLSLPLTNEVYQKSNNEAFNYSNNESSIYLRVLNKKNSTKEILSEISQFHNNRPVDI